MAIEEKLVQHLESILNGVKIDVYLDDWHISSPHGQGIFRLTYGNDEAMEYLFCIEREKKKITISNNHRLARRLGAGTVSLKQLESSFQLLSKKENRPVEVSFITFGQKDTETWLKKNAYEEHDDGMYKKTFRPE